MLVQLLTACGDPDGLELAQAAIDDALEARPVGTAIVMAATTGDVEGTLGGAWRGQDLGEWLAICGPQEADWDVTLRLEPGSWPHTLEDTEGAPSCVTQRLSTFPFEEPSRRGEAARVSVRWRPRDTVTPTAWATGHGETSGALLAQSPPYHRRSPSGRYLKSDLVLSSPERLRPDPESDVVAGDLPDADAWARELTCAKKADDSLRLVRTSLLFDDGELVEVETSPETDCVAERAEERQDWLRSREVGDTPLPSAGRVLVVLDVPVGPW